MEKISIDCQTSDAIMLSIRAGIPILCMEEILANAGLIFDKTKGRFIPLKKLEEVKEIKELENGPFGEFINGLNLQ